MHRRVRIIGPGRAGTSLATVLETIGWEVLAPLGRDDDHSGAAHDSELVVISTPDAVIGAIADEIEPDDGALVIHVAGSLGLDVLADHSRRGALHPLVSLTDAATGSARLRSAAWFAVAANTPEDRMTLESIVADLGGRSFEVADADRAVYHAAAVSASNHLVALFGQVERLAQDCGVPLEAFLSLGSQTLEGLEATSVRDALTGPVQRGDWETVARHLEAIPVEERPGYTALADLAVRLAGHDSVAPGWLHHAHRHDDTFQEESDR